jgi:hypothetical protein
MYSTPVMPAGVKAIDPGVVEMNLGYFVNAGRNFLKISATSSRKSLILLE